MTITRLRPRAVATALLAAAVTTIAVGCSSGDTGTGAVIANNDPSAVVVEGVPPLEQLYRTDRSELPADSPPPARGKSIWFINGDSATPVHALTAAAAQEAGQKLGINVTIADGKWNQGGAWSANIRSAIAAKADGIIVYSVSCEPVRQAFQEAVDAGIPVMGLTSVDCDRSGGPKLFTPFVMNENIRDSYDYFYQEGKNSAAYIVNATNGEARLIYTAGTYPEEAAVDKGFREVFDKCGGCEILDTVEFDRPDLVPNGPWTQAMRAALLANPNANSVFHGFDVMMSQLGGIQAQEEAGLGGAISFGGEGVPDTFDLVRTGRATALTMVRSSEWIGYAAMDQMNRVFNGTEQVSAGINFVVSDKDHNMPEPGKEFDGGVDWKGNYERIWAEAGQ